jgi:hypothetical protein
VICTIFSAPFIDIPKYRRGNMTEVRTHIEGLKKMVAVRGGIGKIRSSSPVTASVAFWYETTSPLPRSVARLYSLTISTAGFRSFSHLNLSSP